MTRKTRKKSKKENPNVRTRAFGPPTWCSMVLIAMGYPKSNPSSHKRALYRRYFKCIGEVLPCNICRTSYRRFLKECPLNARALSGRRNLVFWIFKIHNLVNQKLGCRILNKVQMEKKYKYYDKFRAQSCSKNMGGCTKAAKNIKQPKRIKLVTLNDKKAKKKS
jgi:hypothetical protein